MGFLIVLSACNQFEPMGNDSLLPSCLLLPPAEEGALYLQATD